MRLFLGIPTAGSPAPPFLESLPQLQVPTYARAFERGIVSGNFVPAQRDLLLDRALAWKADVVVMCDDDMVLPPDALVQLCDLLRSDAVVGIAGALYYSRDGLRPMVVDGWDASDTRKGWIPAFDDRTPVAVGGVGFGCVAIRTAAIRHFDRPFFAAQVYVEHLAGRVRVCNEDYLFCSRVRDAGYAIILHPGVRCEHYDRDRRTFAPKVWEPPESTNERRVFVLDGMTRKMIPLAQAPEMSIPEYQMRADVTYVETGSAPALLRQTKERALYLHVGTHKTGTTSLQAFITANAPGLASIGIHVPHAGRPILRFGGAQVGHHNVAWQLNDLDQFDPLDGGLQEVLDEVALVGAPTAILSSEDFEFLYTKPGILSHIAQAFGTIGYTVKVIMYLRSQAEYVQSVYSESAKTWALIDFERYLTSVLETGTFAPTETGPNTCFEYTRLVANFAEVFGKESLIVRPYAGGRDPNALLTEFLGLVGAQPYVMPDLLKPVALNSSPSLLEVLTAMHLRIVDRKPDAVEPEHLLQDTLPGEDPELLTQKFNVLLEPELRALLLRFGNDNRQLEETYGVRVPFQSAHDLPQRGSAHAVAEKQRRILNAAIEQWGIS
jgi:hypothetical protein